VIFSIGDRIYNRWEVFRVLKGGMGIVYIAFDHDVRQFVAIKTFQDELLGKVPQIAERFKREALAWIALDEHENVTRAITAVNINLKPYLILEYVTGGNLRSWIGTPRLISDVVQTIRFSIQFCDGMVHAFQKGVRVHRDIKPENCLITDEPVLKVTDFGLAIATDTGSAAGELVDDSRGEQPDTADRDAGGHSGNTATLGNESTKALGESFLRRLWDKQRGRNTVVSLHLNAGTASTADTRGISEDSLSLSGRVVGTPRYMAPEQFMDAKHVDVRADIYAFGTMLFEMISGRRPFLGNTWKELEHKHNHEAPPALGCDPRLEELVNACLAKDAGARPDTFESIRHTLSEIYRSMTGEPAPSARTGRELTVVDLANKSIALSTFGRHQEAIECCERAVELNPASSTAWVSRGRALSKRDKSGSEEALACCVRALELDPSDFHAWVTKGNCLLDLHRPEEGLASFNRAVELRPGDYASWFVKGWGLNQCSRFSESLYCYDQALQLNPNDAKTWTNKGAVLTALGRAEEALTCLDRAIALENDYLAWNNKANQLVNLGRLEEGLKCFDKVLEMNPRYEQAWVNKGSLLLRMRRPKEALDCCSRGLELDPKDNVAWNIKARVYSDLDQLDNALRCYQRISATDPQNFEGWGNQATTLMLLSRPEQSLECWDRALKLQSNSDRAWYGRSKALAVLQRWEDALASIDSAIAAKHENRAYHREKTVILRYLELAMEGTGTASLKDALDIRRQARIALWLGLKMTRDLSYSIRQMIAEHAKHIEKYEQRRSELTKVDDLFLFIFLVSFTLYFSGLRRNWPEQTYQKAVEAAIEELPFLYESQDEGGTGVTMPQIEAIQAGLRSVSGPTRYNFEQISKTEKNKQGELTFNFFLLNFMRVYPPGVTLMGKGKSSLELGILAGLSNYFGDACLAGASNAERKARIL